MVQVIHNISVCIFTPFSKIICREAPFVMYSNLKNLGNNDTLFPARIWNHNANMKKRVNNNNEDYNYRFSIRTESIPHPNVWKYIEVFQKGDFLLVK